VNCKSFFQLSPISSAASTLDLIVIGCGPAGLSLAAESAKKGLQVGLIGPDLPFTNNYGVWEDEFKGGPRVSVQTAYGVEVEEWSYIPVGGSLPNTEQKNLAFGAAASMVHPATDVAANNSCDLDFTCRMWQGFLGSSLSSVDLIWFAFYMFAVAPNSMRLCLLRHLLSDPTGATMLKTYLTL
ncbi:hypothetical protein GW17_00021809, partial [Ensete ventricosum]